MRTVTAPDGVALAVHEHGGDGRPTLFCHATGFHGAVWEPMSAALGDGFERWAIDFRAHGASVVPPGHPAAVGGGARRPAGGGRRPRRRARRAAGRRPLDGRGRAAARRAGSVRAPSPGSGSTSRSSRRSVRSPPPRAATRSPRAPAGDARRSPPARRPWPTSPPSRRSTWPAPTPSTPTSATGWWRGEDGAVHLACRPDDEARLYEGGAAHGAYDHLGEVQLPGGGGLQRRAVRPGLVRHRRPPRRSPRAASRSTSTSPTSAPSRPPPSSPPSRPGRFADRALTEPVPRGCHTPGVPWGHAVAAAHEPVAVEGVVLHRLRVGVPVLGHRPPPGAAVGGRHAGHARARGAGAAVRAGAGRAHPRAGAGVPRRGDRRAARAPGVRRARARRGRPRPSSTTRPASCSRATSASRTPPRSRRSGSS